MLKDSKIQNEISETFEKVRGWINNDTLVEMDDFCLDFHAGVGVKNATSRTNFYKVGAYVENESV